MGEVEGVGVGVGEETINSTPVGVGVGKVVAAEKTLAVEELVSEKNEVLGYWDKEMLKNSFERKLPRLMYVKADCKFKGSEEEFWFNEAWILKGFDFKNFLKLLKKGVIFVDIRIGQYPDGSPHDHGTGFRVFPDKLELCFRNRKRVV